MEVRHRVKIILNDTLKEYFDRCCAYNRYLWNVMLGMKLDNEDLDIEFDIAKYCRQHRFDWEWDFSSRIFDQVVRTLKKTWNKYGEDTNFKTKKNLKQSFYVHNKGFLEGSFERRSGKHMLVGLSMGQGCTIPENLRWFKLTEDPRYYGREDYKLLSATILKRYDEYYISFCIQIDGVEQFHGTGEVGIDPGVKKLMTLSDGTEYNLPKAKLKRLEEKAKFYQEQMSRRYAKGKEAQSNRYLKAKAKHQATLRKMDDIKTDYLQKATTEIVRNNKFVAWENVNAKDMMKNHKIAKSIAMSCWFKTMKMLDDKCKMHGAKFKKVSPRKGATQKCSNPECDHKFKGKNRLKLSDREYICPKCGLRLDRDLNAAKNILYFAQQKAEVQPRT